LRPHQRVLFAEKSIDKEHFPGNAGVSAMNAISSTPQCTLASNFVEGKLVDREGRLDFILKEMEEGFRVDARTLTNLKMDHESALSRLKKDTLAKSGKTFRLNSNRELGELLFRDFCLPSLRSTPSGKPSVASDVLERLCHLHSDACSLLRLVIEFKNVQSSVKALKTVLKKLDLRGRIHPDFNQTTCPTGRIYSYIQNLPKAVRKVLIPDTDENVFIELDWSQQELRILGALSQEAVFLDSFAKGEDLHRRVISEMFDKPISEVTLEERKIGKTINYALIYGQEAAGLSWTLNISRKRTQELIDQYFSALPMIKRFKKECRERFLETDRALTPFGRGTKLDLTGGNRARELRRGFNHLIQGTGADLLRITMVRLHEALKTENARLKFCAHDAIYFEAKREAAQEVAELAKSIMEIRLEGVLFPVMVKIHTDFSMGEC
jgi:DNA polymerase-1